MFGRKRKKHVDAPPPELQAALQDIAANIPGVRVGIDDEASSANRRGAELAAKGKLLDALAEHRRALRTYERDDSERGQGVTLAHIGIVLRDLGRTEEAMAAFAAGADLSTEAVDYRHVMVICEAWGKLLQQVGRYSEAVTVHRREAGAAAELRDGYGAISARLRLTTALRGAGEFDDSVRAHQRAIEIADEIEDVHMAAILRGMLGERLWAVGREPEAVETFTAAVHGFRQAGDDEAADAVEHSLREHRGS